MNTRSTSRAAASSPIRENAGNARCHPLCRPATAHLVRCGSKPNSAAARSRAAWSTSPDSAGLSSTSIDSIPSVASNEIAAGPRAMHAVSPAKHIGAVLILAPAPLRCRPEEPPHAEDWRCRTELAHRAPGAAAMARSAISSDAANTWTALAASASSARPYDQLIPASSAAWIAGARRGVPRQWTGALKTMREIGPADGRRICADSNDRWPSSRARSSPIRVSSARCASGHGQRIAGPRNDLCGRPNRAVPVQLRDQRDESQFGRSPFRRLPIRFRVRDRGLSPPRRWRARPGRDRPKHRPDRAPPSPGRQPRRHPRRRRTRLRAGPARGARQYRRARYRAPGCDASPSGGARAASICAARRSRLSGCAPRLARGRAHKRACDWPRSPAVRDAASRHAIAPLRVRSRAGPLFRSSAALRPNLDIDRQCR